MGPPVRTFIVRPLVSGLWELSAPKICGFPKLIMNQSVNTASLIWLPIQRRNIIFTTLMRICGKVDALVWSNEWNSEYWHYFRKLAFNIYNILIYLDNIHCMRLRLTYGLNLHSTLVQEFTLKLGKKFIHTYNREDSVLF